MMIVVVMMMMMMMIMMTRHERSRASFLFDGCRRRLVIVVMMMMICVGVGVRVRFVSTASAVIRYGRFGRRFGSRKWGAVGRQGLGLVHRRRRRWRATERQRRTFLALRVRLDRFPRLLLFLHALQDHFDQVDALRTHQVVQFPGAGSFRVLDRIRAAGRVDLVVPYRAADFVRAVPDPLAVLFPPFPHVCLLDRAAVVDGIEQVQIVPDAHHKIFEEVGTLVDHPHPQQGPAGSNVNDAAAIAIHRDEIYGVVDCVLCGV